MMIAAFSSPKDHYYFEVRLQIPKICTSISKDGACLLNSSINFEIRYFLLLVLSISFPDLSAVCD